MDITVQNMGRFSYWLTLSDGRSIELSPKGGKVVLPQRELEVNGALKKMLDRGLVQMSESGKTAPKNSRPKAHAKATGKKATSKVKP